MSEWPGPRCDGTHQGRPCPDPKCVVKSRMFSDAVRRGLRQNEANRKLKELEAPPSGPAFGHETDSDD